MDLRCEALTFCKGQMANLRIMGLALGLVAVLLTACADESAVVSGEVQGSGVSHPLSERQVKALNLWLHEHSSGWGLVLATPPEADLVVFVRHENGTSGHLDFYAQQGWKGALTYFGRDPRDNEQGGFAVDQLRGLRSDLESPQ
jgi:hypothetical protein